MATSEEKLKRLEEIEGMEPIEMAKSALTDGTCPGICMNDDCEYTTDVEPDQDKGWCDECQQNTVKSVVMLLGVI